MKRIFTLLFTMAFCITSFAQNIGIGTTAPTNKLEVVSTVTSAPNATIYGTNTGSVGSALYGISHSAGTSGVQGTSNFGTGVYGTTTNYIAVGAGAINGTGVYASSVSSKALEVLGNIRLSGGDTNPSDGAVLTSDADGNAVWKEKKVGFFANTANNSSVPISTFRKVEFSVKDFDLKNNFVPYSGTVTTGTSVFTAPVAGIYNFASSVLFQTTSGMESGQIRIVKNASGTVLANEERQAKYLATSSLSVVSLEIQSDAHLNAGDKIWIEVAQRNISGNAIGLSNISFRGRFSGILKIAD